MGALWHDVKYTFRMLRKHPGFTAIALITLAIGIGANTIMFSLVNTLFLRPVQVKQINELAVCRAENADWHFSYAAYTELRESNPVFTDMAAVSGMAVLSALFVSKIVPYELSVFDPATFVIVTSVLLITAALACLIPALRAAKVDPMKALRCE